MALDSNRDRNYKVFQDIDLARNKILNSAEIVAPCWKENETAETESGSLIIKSGDTNENAKITISNSGNISIKTKLTSDPGLNVTGTSNFDGSMVVSSAITVKDNNSKSKTNPETNINNESVTTNNVVFNETLESNDFEIVWDSTNFVLTFKRKKIETEEDKKTEQ